MASGHVQMSLGGYYMQYYGMIEPIFDPEDAAATSEGNIPFSLVKGLECSMNSNFGHLSFDMGAALNKSVLGQIVEYATYAFPPGYQITNQCAPGVTPNPTKTCTNYTPYYASVSGEALPFAPLFSAHATLQYTIPMGDTSVVPRVVYSYQGNSYSGLFQNGYFLLPEHSLWNAYVDWDAGQWKTTLWATNLANTLYVQGVSGNAEYFGNPRQYGLELNRSF
jgi:iron complex outermembrane recepter protein